MQTIKSCLALGLIIAACLTPFAMLFAFSALGVTVPLAIGFGFVALGCSLID